MRLGAISMVLSLAAPVAADPRPPRGYQLRLESGTVDVRPGAEGAVSLTVVPRPGYSIDRDGPLRIRVSVDPAEGLEVSRRSYRRADAADARADAPRFDLRYRAVSPGNYALHIDARFWVCRRYTCRAAHETRSVAIRVNAPAPTQPPADAAPPQ